MTRSLSKCRAGLVLLGTIAVQSCASHSHTPFTNRWDGAAERCMPAVVTLRQTEHDECVVDDAVLRRSSRYVVRRLSFPSVGDNAQEGDLVTVDYHQSQLRERLPAVVVLPIWGISTFPPRAVVKQIRRASNGLMHVVDVQGEAQIFRWAELRAAPDEEAFVRAWQGSAERERTWLEDLRRLLDWVVDQPEVDPARVGLVGFSHSAMMAALLAAQDTRIAATVLVMAGARAPEIIARCEGRRTTPVQLVALQRFGWDANELEHRLETIFSGLSPVDYAGCFDPDRVLMFEARDDPCISPAAREELWRAMGRPERFTIHAEHRKAFYSMTILGANWMQRQIWRFLDRVLVDGAELARPR